MSFSRLIRSIFYAVAIAVLIPLLPPIVSIIIAIPHLAKLYGSWVLTELRFVFEYSLQQTTGSPEVFSNVQAPPDISTVEISPTATRYGHEKQITGVNSFSSNIDTTI